MSDNPQATPPTPSPPPSSSSSSPTVIAADPPLPSLPLSTSIPSSSVASVSPSPSTATDDDSYVLLDDSDQAAHTPSAALAASLTTSPCSPMVIVAPLTPSPSPLPLPLPSSRDPASITSATISNKTNNDMSSSSRANSTETNDATSSPISAPRSLRVTPPLVGSAAVPSSSSSPLSATSNSPGGGNGNNHNDEPGHPQSLSSHHISHARGSSGWAHDDNDNDNEDNDDYDDISDDYHELRARKRHGNDGQEAKSHVCDDTIDNDNEHDNDNDDDDNNDNDMNDNDDHGDNGNGNGNGNEYGAEFFRSVLIYGIIFMMAALTTLIISRLVGTRGMPLSVTIVKMVNGKQVNDTTMIYTNTRSLSLMARISPATSIDTQALTYEWRYHAQSDTDNYLPIMLGWNSPILQLPNGLQAGNRSFVVRITRGHGHGYGNSNGGNGNDKSKKKNGDTMEATITVNVIRSIVMGIDLGTTYGCMAYVPDDDVDNHHVIPVPLDHDHICMPMTIAFHSLSSYARMNASSQPSPILMGMAAKKLTSLIPDRVFRDMKRIIGRSPVDTSVRDFQTKMLFTIIDCNQHQHVYAHAHGQLPYDSPCIRVNMSRSLVPLLSPLSQSNSNGNGNGVDDVITLSLLPEQMLSLIMMRMKLAAAAYTSQDVTDCVITVPAQWNNGQRKATMDAAILAGWNVMKVINEPTSAVFAYGMLEGYDQRAVTHRVLVFDWGGGTVDVSLVTIQSSGAYKVESTNGNMTLGGEDIDARIAHHLLGLLLVRYGVDLRTPQRVGERAHVLYEAERAKRALSHHESYSVSIPVDSRVLDIMITRQQMEIWCNDLFESAMIPVMEVLHDAYSHNYLPTLSSKLGSDDALTVLMVGGSSYIPKVKTLLAKLFPSGTKIYLPNSDASSSQLTPELAVAYGAALAGKRLNDLRHAHLGLNPEGGSTSSFLMDITPMSLGVKIYAQKDGSDYLPLIKRNVLYPVEQSGTFQSVFDYQRIATINVYEGESNHTYDNHFVGRFDIKLPLLPQGQARLLIAYTIDANGILTVTATSGIDNKSQQMQVYSQDGRIPRSMLVSLRDASNIMLTYTNRDTDIMMVTAADGDNGNEGIIISTIKRDAYESYSSSSTILPLSTPQQHRAAAYA